MPENPNDFMIDYYIMRRSSCLAIVDNLATCESSLNQVCCDGIYFDKKYGFECCGKNYIPKPFEYQSVCCGGQFYEKKTNYECCAGLYYLYVPIGQTCCSNIEENYIKEIR